MQKLIILFLIPWMIKIPRIEPFDSLVLLEFLTGYPEPANVVYALRKICWWQNIDATSQGQGEITHIGGALCLACNRLATSEKPLCRTVGLGALWRRSGHIYRTDNRQFCKQMKHSRYGLVQYGRVMSSCIAPRNSPAGYTYTHIFNTLM